MTETQLVKMILAHLSITPGCAVGIPSKNGISWVGTGPAVFWRQNTGATETKNGFMRFGLPGQADITGCVRGRRIEIEVKTETGAQSTLQKTFAQKIFSSCGVYILARSVDDALQPILALLKHV